MKSKLFNRLIKNLTQEIVNKHINDALESVGVKSKINFLLYPENVNVLNMEEILEKLLKNTKFTTEVKKILRRQTQKIMIKRDSGKCEMLHPKKKLKLHNHIGLR